MSAQPKLQAVAAEPGRFLRLQERKRLRRLVEDATAYECDNTEPLEGPLLGYSEMVEEQRLDGRRRRRVRGHRIASTGVAAWLRRKCEE